MFFIKGVGFSLLLCFMFFFYLYHVSSSINIQFVSKGEKTWQSAYQFCHDLTPSSVLPSSFELLSLFVFRDDVFRNKETDYWSRNVFFGRGFGLNSRYGMLSFDGLHDQDHFLCLKKER